MKYFDYTLFLHYHLYKRGNKNTFGAFTISALWLAFLQHLWLFILISPFEFMMNQQLMIGVQTPVGFALYTFSFAVFNIIYLNTKNRKQKILQKFNPTRKEERRHLLYFYAFCGITLVLAIIARYYKTDLYGL
jgi:hypothetical protein